MLGKNGGGKDLLTSYFLGWRKRLMKCPRCGSSNVNVQVVAEQKKRGCIMSLFWILLAICTLGLVILIPLLIQKGSKTRAYAVCQNCGRKWRA